MARQTIRTTTTITRTRNRNSGSSKGSTKSSGKDPPVKDNLVVLPAGGIAD